MKQYCEKTHIYSHKNKIHLFISYCEEHEIH